MGILFHRSSLYVLANLLFVPTHIYSLRELCGKLLPLISFNKFPGDGVSHGTSSKIKSNNNNILQMELFQGPVRLVTDNALGKASLGAPNSSAPSGVCNTAGLYSLVVARLPVFKATLSWGVGDRNRSN